MRGDRLYKILELIESGVDAMEDFFVGITSPYGSSFSGMNYNVEQNRRRREKFREEENERQRIYELVARLKRDGLVVRNDPNSGKLIKLTKKGKEKLKRLSVIKRKRAEISYPIQDEQTLKIIIYDIPEKERKKREWIRAVLINLKFKLLQKSVWIGRTALPQKFIDDILKFRLMNYIEIFEITKKGSIRKI